MGRDYRKKKNVNVLYSNVCRTDVMANAIIEGRQGESLDINNEEEQKIEEQENESIEEVVAEEE